jgi:hypothetical protein
MQTRQARLEGTGEIRLRELVKQSLRMRPSRMMCGQIWGCETSAPCRPALRGRSGAVLRYERTYERIAFPQPDIVEIVHDNAVRLK